MTRIILLVIAFFVLVPNVAHGSTEIGGTVTPCLTKITKDTVLTREQRRQVVKRRVDGVTEEWMMSAENCTQYHKPAVISLARIRIEHSALKLENINLKLTLKNNAASLNLWEKVRLVSWESRLKTLQGMVKDAHTNMDIWKGTAKSYRLKWQSASPKWYAHPVFVATVTAIITTAVIGVSSRIMR